MNPVIRCGSRSLNSEKGNIADIVENEAARIARALEGRQEGASIVVKRRDKTYEINIFPEDQSAVVMATIQTARDLDLPTELGKLGYGQTPILGYKI